MDAAKRELQDEAGIEADSRKIILTTHISNSVTDEYYIIFLATDIRQSTATPEDIEDICIKKIPFEEAVLHIDDGRITDSTNLSSG